ncbi:MAG: DUF6531 domain-containing protein [Candidatus Thiodiazotropha sp.]|nr:DUF6531 domain-containing protein [Candidatus Thiodiazotropha sp.]MCM8882938.1 DUF6531 domain-containing protein [Candidatus Thiodiazotropha sp.]
MPIIGNMSRWFSRQRGVAMTELLVSLPALLLMGLGGWQTALLYDAKTTLNYATFEAARKGAVTHAQSGPMRQELGLRLAPLFGGDGSPRKAIAAITRSSLDVEDPRFTEFEIINPTVEAFDDFGREIVDPRTNDIHFGIPNSHLRWRDRSINEHSGVNIQDANLLKVKVTYGYQLKVPLMDRVIPAVMRLFDPENALYYNSRRLPITSVATVRMQSDAWRDDNNVHAETPGGGATPPPSEDDPEQEGTPPDDEEGQGGDDDDTDDPDSSNEGDGQDNGSGDNSDGDTGGCDNNDGDDLPSISDGDDQGGPMCPTTQDGDSASPTAQSSGIASTHTGNPIHVVTGNKYQQEVDLTPLPGALGLLFKRHYNSHNDESGHLGRGWSHSYDLRLQADGEAYRLRQSDGRVIHFEPSNTADHYTAPRASDGWLRVNEAQLTWHWRDGRQLQFSPQGQLQRIVLATGQTLKLFYDPQGKLFLVRDPQSRELTLDHYPNGRIKALYDPTGQATRYRYDEVGNLKQVTRADDSQRLYHYEDTHDTHNLTGITDERGIRYATWAYDNQDRAILSTHADQVGQVKLDFSTPSETKVTDSQGKVSRYTTEVRDGVALVTAIHGPGCSSCGKGDVSYRYNEQLQLSEIATQDGIIKQYSYDEQGRTTAVIQQVTGGVSQTIVRHEYTDDTVLKPSAVIHPSVHPQGEHRIETRYNASGQTTELTERGYRPEADGGYTPIQRTTRLAYDEAGNLTVIDGPREDVEDRIQLSYDSMQRLSGITLADGTTQNVLAYDNYGRPSKIQNGNQTPLTIRYSELGKPQQIRQGQRNVSYAYDAVGRLVSVTEPDGETLNLDYDAAGRAVSMRDAEGNSVRKLIDSENRLLAHSIESAQGDVHRATIYLRDANQRLRGVVTPEGIQRMVGYDEKGKKTLDTNGGGKGSYFMRTKTGALKAVTDADGGELRKARLANGHITLTQDSLKRIDLLVHDDFGNRIVWRNPDSGLAYYRYDQAGNLIEKRDAASNTTNYEYDAADRLIGLESPDGITHLRYQAGLLAEVQGPNSRQRYSYDNEGRLVSHSREIDGHLFTTTYTYDPKTGKLITRQLPGGERLTYRYQANQGRLSAVIKSGWLSEQPLLEGITYEPFGRITGYTHADGGRTEKGYDKSGRLIRQAHTGFGKYKLAYNVAGELVLIEKDQQQNRYVYDAAGRLHQADTATGRKAYRYDALGNRLAEPSGSLKQVSAQTPASAASNTGKSKKDRLGRVTALGQRHWEYNAAGQPVRFYRGERLVAAYRYNHKGERIRKTVYPDDPAQAPETTYYLYDLQQRLSAEADEDGDIIRQYLYLDRTPYAMLKDGVAYSIQSDHLGAPHSVTDEKSRLKWQADYDPFGRATVKTQRIGFNLRRPGQYEDAESGLYDNYLRRYDPDSGRYLEPDPLGNLDGMNRYAYVGNRPLERTDPLGLFGVRAGTRTIYLPISPIGTPVGITIGAGSAVHETIVLEAFERFNREHSGAFSNHTIDLFIAANVRTDLMFDAGHQFSGANHFDNPNDTPWNQDSGPSNWIMDSINSIQGRRSNYAGDNIQAGCTMEREPIYDIASLVEDFGSLTHTLADFYAHTNWADPTSRGGAYHIERETYDYGLFREGGYVPPGLNMNETFDFDTMSDAELSDWMTRLYSGNAEGCADLECAILGMTINRNNWNGDLNLSPEDSYYHNVTGGQDNEGRWDETTHAYWQKDDREKAEDIHSFIRASQLAVAHTVEEIERLWAESEGNEMLRRIYAANEQQKEGLNVYYAERPLNGTTSDCPLCPVFATWRDHRVDINNP